MKSIKAGDKVTTSSGIIGIVVTVKDRSVSIRSADTKLEVLKSAISEITERERPEPAGQSCRLSELLSTLPTVPPLLSHEPKTSLAAICSSSLSSPGLIVEMTPPTGRDLLAGF